MNTNNEKNEQIPNHFHLYINFRTLFYEDMYIEKNDEVKVSSPS